MQESEGRSEEFDRNRRKIKFFLSFFRFFFFFLFVVTNVSEPLGQECINWVGTSTKILDRKVEYFYSVGGPTFGICIGIEREGLILFDASHGILFGFI